MMTPWSKSCGDVEMQRTRALIGHVRLAQIIRLTWRAPGWLARWEQHKTVKPTIFVCRHEPKYGHLSV